MQALAANTAAWLDPKHKTIIPNILCLMVQLYSTGKNDGRKSNLLQVTASAPDTLHSCMLSKKVEEVKCRSEAKLSEGSVG